MDGKDKQEGHTKNPLENASDHKNSAFDDLLDLNKEPVVKKKQSRKKNINEEFFLSDVSITE